MLTNANQPPAVTSVLPAKELTDKSIKLAKPGDVLNDPNVRGLSLRAFPESKGFYLYFRTKAGVQRRPKLGDYGSITLAQARKVAQEMLAEVAAGRDPAQDRQAARAEPTVADLWDEYWKRHGSKKKSGDQDKLNWTNHVKSVLGSSKLSAVTYSQVSDLMDGMAATPIAGNRTLALLSKMFNFATRPLEWTEKNPCRGVKRYPEVKRRRYMAGEEAARIAELLDREAGANPASVAFLYLLILTGARKGEIAAAKWGWFNGSILALPDSKTGAKSVYLPPQALDVLARLPRTTGTITGIQSPKKLWEKIRDEAGCPDLRMHDLRHNFASAALSAGLSLSQIGELLGHKSTQTTKRYAHLVEDVANAAATRAADHIMLGMKKSPDRAGEK
jgi:integrase